MCSPGQSPREQVLAELASTDHAGLPADVLMERAGELAAFIGQMQGELARICAALDSAGLQDYGYRSAAAFLRAACGLAPGRAGELVTAGRGLVRMPTTQKALATGEVSFDQALVAVRTATEIQQPPGPADIEEQTAELGVAELGVAEQGLAEQRTAAQATAETAERVLLEAASGGVTVSQLRQLGEEIAYRAAPQAAEDRERRRWEKRYLSFGLTLDATGTLSGACGDAVTFETIRTAAEAFGPPGGSLDTRSAAQRRLDGLAAACRSALDTGAAPVRHGSAPHISVLVHDHTLAQAAQADRARPQATDQEPPPAQQPPAQQPAQQPAPQQPAPQQPAPQQPAPQQPASAHPASAHPALQHPAPQRPSDQRPDQRPSRRVVARGAPPGRTGHGTMLSASQVLALCCGAEITAIRWEDGLPLDVGRASRTEPPALRKALEARDRTCRWPGCETPGAWATGHHIRGWANGAKTSLNEIVLLCHVHHAHFIHLLGWTITGDPNATLHFTQPGSGITLRSPLPEHGPPLGHGPPPDPCRPPADGRPPGHSPLPEHGPPPGQPRAP